MSGSPPPMAGAPPGPIRTVCVVGSGGREHALAVALGRTADVIVTPGNPGIGGCAECVPLGAEDLIGVFQFVRDKGVDLTVVGPEDPLALGMADELAERGFRVFGPTRAAAELERDRRGPPEPPVAGRGKGWA